MSAIPTRRVAVTLVKDDGTESQIVAEFFSVRKMIWIRSELVDASSLKRVVIEGQNYSITAFENKPTICEIRIERE